MKLIYSLISLIFIVLSFDNVNSQFTSTGFPIQVLSPLSPWNSLIGSSPSIDPQSAAMITRIKNALISQGYATSLGLSYYQWTSPIHNIDTSVTVNRITIYNPQNEAYHESVDPLATQKVLNLPVSTTFQPDPQADGHMIIFDTNLKVFHEFSRFKWINSTTASATRYDTFPYNDMATRNAFTAGTRWWMSRVRGAGSVFIGGLIRYDEIVRGDVNHALAFSGPVNRIKALSSSSWDIELCANTVASRSDGYVVGVDTIMEGQRIQLNPSYDISALPPKSKLIAQALKSYGGFMVDNGGTFSLYFENKGPSATSPWVTNYGADLSQLETIPLEQFRVISCPTIATKTF